MYHLLVTHFSTHYSPQIDVLLIWSIPVHFKLSVFWSAECSFSIWYKSVQPISSSFTLLCVTIDSHSSHSLNWRKMFMHSWFFMSLKNTTTTTGIYFHTLQRTAFIRHIWRYICCDVNIETLTDFRNWDKGNNSKAIRNNKNQKIISRERCKFL